MAKFASSDGRIEMSTAVIDLDKPALRLDLGGAVAARTDLSVESRDTGVVAVSGGSPFNGPKGIWTVNLRAVALGMAEVLAKLKKAEVAKLAVVVTTASLIVSALIGPGLALVREEPRAAAGTVLVARPVEDMVVVLHNP